MPPVLMDTNLLVYLYDFHTPHKQVQARNVLWEINLSHSGRISVQSLAEFFQVTTRRLNPPLSISDALDQVNFFLRMWPVFDLTPLIVMEAARGVRDHGLAYFDAQIWAAARLNQVTVIFSEDFSHGQVLEGVRFINPFAPDFHLKDWL